MYAKSQRVTVEKAKQSLRNGQASPKEAGSCKMHHQVKEKKKKKNMLHVDMLQVQDLFYPYEILFPLLRAGVMQFGRSFIFTMTHFPRRMPSNLCHVLTELSQHSWVTCPNPNCKQQGK